MLSSLHVHICSELLFYLLKCTHFFFLLIPTVKDLASSEAQQRSLTAELDSVRAKLSEVGDERRRGNNICTLVVDMLYVLYDL